MTQPIQSSPVTPLENVQRGTVFALIVIPAGIIVWALLWSVGFIASIVAYGVAFGAVWLYRRGSGGVVTRRGVIRIVVITVATLLLSFFGGMVLDVVREYSKVLGTSWIEALTSSMFWHSFGGVLVHSGYLGSIALPLVLALVFAFLGSYRILRNALRATRPAAGAPPTVPPADPTQAIPGQTILNGEPLPPTKD